MAFCSRIEEGRDLRRALPETEERERGLRGSDDRWDPHGGEREEGLTGLGLFGGKLGQLAPGYGPSGLLAPSFYFYFFPVFFFFCF
jgi:hypothetical protein